MLQWLIIGGGIHGCHLAVRLLGEAGVHPAELAILDPGERLLERWRKCTATTGMTHLRSPSVHHLALHPWALQRFAGKRKRRPRGLFRAPYDRPSLKLFNSHCDQQLAEYGLQNLHEKGWAHHCRATESGFEVECHDGRVLRAQHVVLAIGTGEALHFPDWALRGHPQVRHIFERGFDTATLPDKARVGVVGAGISACQLSLKLIEMGHQVHQFVRGPLRVHQFDSEPGWMGPMFMHGFSKEPSAAKRRKIITAARHRGSVPPEVAQAIAGARAQSGFHWHEGEVSRLEEVAPASGTPATLRLFGTSESSQRGVELDHLLLATGTAPKPPGGSLVRELRKSLQLPCGACGFPTPSEHLEWSKGLYVTGALAELELGPIARNIAGARRAGDRILEGYCPSPGAPECQSSTWKKPTTTGVFEFRVGKAPEAQTPAS